MSSIKDLLPPDSTRRARPAKRQGATRQTDHRQKAGLIRQHRGVWIFSLVALLATVTIASMPPRDVFEARPPTDLPVMHPTQVVHVPDLNGQLTQTVIPGAPAQASVAPVAGERSLNWKQVPIRRGDTLSGLLDQQGLSRAEINQLIESHPEAKALYRLVAGESLRVAVDHAGVLQELVYTLSSSEQLHFKRTPAGFTASKDVRTFETRLAYVSGVIQNSLFVDGQNAGLSETLIMQMVDIFGWDIDFAQDLRGGDSFAIIFEEKTWQGEKVADGAIVAAEFINQGREAFRAFAHRDEKGSVRYFNGEGMSMRRAFLRSPLKFSRITSRFSLNRFHPVLKQWRAHNGVDYGAPTGTPVMSTASGRVIFVGAKGGYGNTVVLKHGGSYSTLYAHLSRFRSGLRVGAYVEQGDTIGYVGSTGLATGAHLHYEFQVNGVHRNPLTYQFPQAEPIAAEYKREFLETAQALGTRLDLVSQRTVAASE